MLNKALIRICIGMIVLSTMPVHAISQKYRQQLERSGCTQMTDGNGCDITKTKSENIPGKISKERKELTEFLRDSVVGQKADDAFEALKGYGYSSSSPDVWSKSEFTVILNIKNSIINQATIKNKF